MRSEDRLIGLQYLRGIVASIVVLHHLRFPDTQLGPFGVKIFFVISGFVMWYTTSMADLAPIAFWRQRIIRIVPLYWLFLLLLIVAGLACSTCVKTTELTAQNVPLSFLFIPHFHQIQKGLIAPILIPGWSLNYEMFFYFVFGSALFIKSNASRVLAIAVLFWSLVLLGRWLDPSSAILSTYTNPSLLLFLNGLLLAMVYQTYEVDGAGLGVTLASVSILSQTLMVLQGGIESFLGVAAVLIVAGTLALESTLRRAPSNLLLGIGAASYSIYLSHLFFLRVFEICWSRVAQHDGGGIVETASIVLAFVFAIVGGVAVHHLIERPMVRQIRQRWWDESERGNNLSIVCPAGRRRKVV
ncbi:exopolysaccharide production protein ExoZ [Bradyrhizobium sp. F1.4.3]|uniref:acyltransferase family protein n=1 Tax=Bradyrhizobium sp. F1.4.3 TaxID=3156356 RepID=UPI00339B616D